MVSIATALFVIVGRAIGLTSEYRESEATSKRKRDIDEKLKVDLKMRQNQYVKMEHGQSNGDTLFTSLEELGKCAFLSRSLTSNMLDSLTRNMKSGLRNLAVAIVMLALAVLTGVFGDFSYSSQQGPGSGYVITALALLFLAGFGYAAYGALGKHLKLRDYFVKLSETPSLQCAEQLFDELRQQNLF